MTKQVKFKECLDTEIPVSEKKFKTFDLKMNFA